MTTFLTIDRIRTLGNNGAKSSGKHDLSEQKPLNGLNKIRKKIIPLFGFKMPGVRISPLGPNKSDNFDTIGIETIRLILFLKMPMAQGFSAPVPF